MSPSCHHGRRYITDSSRSGRVDRQHIRGPHGHHGNMNVDEQKVSSVVSSPECSTSSDTSPAAAVQHVPEAVTGGDLSGSQRAAGSSVVLAGHMCSRFVYHLTAQSGTSYARRVYCSSSPLEPWVNFVLNFEVQKKVQNKERGRLLYTVIVVAAA